MKFKTTVLAAKVLAVAFLSVFVCALFVGWLVYRVSILDLEQSLRQSLERLAVTASLMIDGDQHSQIESVESPEYRAIQSILYTVKQKNNLDAPIYTLKRGVDKNTAEVVVTTDPAYLMGARYKLRPEMSRAFNRAEAASSGFYKDKTGAWISAYAPVMNRAGQVAALLKVQHHAGYIFGRLRGRLWMLILVSVGGFAISALVAIPMISPITNSINKLDAAASKLESGNYDHEVDIRSNDEIGHLADTFEKMRKNLKADIIQLRDAWLKEKKAHLESVLTLSRAIEIRDPYTKGHVEKVSEYAVLLGRELGLSERDLEKLRHGSMLHDLGKLDVNMDILSKPSKLTKEEREKVRLHTEYGAEIIKDIEFLETAREIIQHHHELFDGTGYPNGLKGEDIPLMARIVTLLDAFDAMTSDRPYREKISDEEAYDIIIKESGKQFDPKICRAFLKIKPEIIKAKNKFA